MSRISKIQFNLKPVHRAMGPYLYHFDRIENTSDGDELFSL